MSRYFAQINNENIVEQVIIAGSVEWCVETFGGNWVETFMDNPGKNFAGKGYFFHRDKQNFSAERPFPSWTLDENCKWAPLVPAPEDVNVRKLTWSEKQLDWKPREEVAIELGLEKLIEEIK